MRRTNNNHSNKVLQSSVICEIIENKLSNCISAISSNFEMKHCQRKLINEHRK